MGDNEAWSPGGQMASPRRSVSPRREEERDSRRDYEERDSRREYDDRARYERYDRDERRDDRRGPPAPRNGGNGAGSAAGNNNANEANPGNNLHVSGVSKLLDDHQLEEAFAKYGKVVKTQIMYDPHSRESRGFAFITFETSEEADAAIAGLNGEELSGRTLTVQKARRARARSPTPGRYQGPPKARGGGPRSGGDRYGPPGGYDRWGPPPRGYYPPPRDFDGWGPPPHMDRYGPPPRGYDRYAYPPPPPPRDYLPPRGGYREYSPPPTMRPGRGAYDDYARAPRYDDLPPPPPPRQ